MPKNIRLSKYFVGIAVVGGALYFITTSSTNSKEFPQKLRESQGILHNDIIETRKNTQQLMTKLQQGAGLAPKDK